MDFAIQAYHRVEIKESRKVDKYSDLARELRKLWNVRMVVIPVVIGALGTVFKAWKKDWKKWQPEEELRPSRFVEIGQNAEKSPGGLRRLAVTQTLVKADGYEKNSQGVK